MNSIGKKILYIFSGAILYSFSLCAQGSYKGRFPDRYQLELPAEWNRPKVIDAISTILPKAIEELKDKDFCTDCLGAYTVKLVLDSPAIRNRSNISKGYTSKRKITEGGRLVEGAANNVTMQVIYQFRASLGIYDSSGKRVTELLLLPFAEEQVKTKDTIMGGMYYGTETVRDLDGRVTKMLVPHYETIPISNVLKPERDDLVKIAEQRIYFIRDLIKKLN